MCVGSAELEGDRQTGFLPERSTAGSADTLPKKNQIMSPVKPLKTNLLLKIPPPPSGASMLALPRACHRVRPQKHNA